MKPTVGPDVKTVIEVRPHRWGWKAFEAPGVEPVFPKKIRQSDIGEVIKEIVHGEERYEDLLKFPKRGVACRIGGYTQRY